MQGVLGRAYLGVRSLPRCMWVVFFIKILESYAYFSMSLSMTLFLSDTHGFSDVEAGWIYGTWGMLTSVYGLALGWAVDCLGIRRSLVAGGILSALGRFLFAVCRKDQRGLLYLSCFGLMPAGAALGIPVLTIAVKRYSSAQHRTFAFGLFYAVMNVAALISGPATDLCNHAIGDKGLTLSGIGTLSPLRVLFLSGVLATLLLIAVSTCLVKEVKIDEDGTTVAHHPKPASVRGVVEVCREPRLRRLVLLSTLVVAVRLVFRHLDATLPKWMLREIGPQAKYGAIYSINPAMIILLVPVVAAATSQYPAYAMIVYGSFVSAGSVFFLCIGPYYWCAAMFVVTLSLGEALYSPKVYEYSMQLATEGNEGLYTSLASAPMFVAKFFAGGLSGVLLQAYCPKELPRRCSVMWLIIGAISCTSPILMLLFRHYIEGKDDGHGGSSGGSSGGSGDATSVSTSRFARTRGPRLPQIRARQKKHVKLAHHDHHEIEAAHMDQPCGSADVHVTSALDTASTGRSKRTGAKVLQLALRQDETSLI